MLECLSTDVGEQQPSTVALVGCAYSPKGEREVVPGKGRSHLRKQHWDEARRLRLEAERSHSIYLASAVQEYPFSADDVEVGFPSVARFTSAIKRSFFGSSDTGLDKSNIQRRVLELTSRNAREGAQFPIEIESKLSCPVCAGSGERWPDLCGVCAGIGAVVVPQRLDVRVPAGVRDGTWLRLTVRPLYSGEIQVDVRVAVGSR